ncbi:nicotinate-nucleotide--dimethylbenzimidazole phosphoribosyltransferase [Dethiothermospora halolimnae]|uniref:nicotinate-nucleotide--dimethylbenzimidazole phosphoribosyltransferase n=1 Tax=Dethiothermospora halolimnae TaxID=3114390 RepID=UPI003CCB8E6D
MNLLNETIKKIKGVDREIMEKCKNRVDNLIKPVGSLGKLEDIVIKLAGITGDMYPKVDNKSVIVMAADHGVCEEGIAAAPKEVTLMQAINMTKGLTGVCAMAKQAKSDVVVVDIGIDGEINNDKIINKKIKHGTENITKGPAMTRKEAITSIETGILVATEEIKKGKNILTTGEMGIGNTTPSAAIVSAITGMDPKEVTWVGANLPMDKLKNKINCVKRAIEVNKPIKEDTIDVLSKVGGLEIGGMAGVMLACAANRVPIVIDGFICTVAALIAYGIEPKVKEYLIPSHSSEEKGAKYASEILGLKPMLDMNMRLGEGSGGVLAFNIIEAATYMNNEMITFKEAGIGVV